MIIDLCRYFFFYPLNIQKNQLASFRIRWIFDRFFFSAICSLERFNFFDTIEQTHHLSCTSSRHDNYRHSSLETNKPASYKIGEKLQIESKIEHLLWYELRHRFNLAIFLRLEFTINHFSFLCCKFPSLTNYIWERYLLHQKQFIPKLTGRIARYPFAINEWKTSRVRIQVLKTYFLARQSLIGKDGISYKIKEEIYLFQFL